MTYPITPPPELVEQWVTEACPECYLSYDEFTGESVEILATRAAQWGADQELQAVCQLLFSDPSASYTLSDIRAARRPKPSSLKEQALAVLETLFQRSFAVGEAERDTIRQALEQLDD